MNKITIIDVCYGSENTLTILKNNQIFSLSFTTLEGLIEEIIFRTCEVIYAEYNCDEECINDKQGVPILKFNSTKKVNTHLKQVVDIDMVISTRELNDIYGKLCDKGLEITPFKRRNVNSILPILSYVGYQIN